MKYKKLLVLILCLFCIKNSVCMQEEIFQENKILEKDKQDIKNINKEFNKLDKETENSKKIVENQITRGEKILINLSAIVKNKESKKDKDSIIKTVARNIIEFGVHKAINSEEDLISELKRLPVLGVLILKIGFVESFSGYVKNIQKEKESIKIEMENTLRKELETGNNLSFKEEIRDFSWSKKEITNPRLIDSDEAETALDLICLGNRIAVNNKEFLKFFLQKARVGGSWLGVHNLLYYALSYSIVPPYVEKKLEDRYFPKKKILDLEITKN